MEKFYFNPGCALSIYKPELESRILKFLNKNYAPTKLHKICCRHDPALPSDSLIINVCAGCDRRFRSLYDGIKTKSLWEILDESETFPFPDYNGAYMSIQDPCPVRDRPAVHKAVRSLLQKMNITVKEPERYGTNSVCCGDSFYPKLSIDEIYARMRSRANDMPCDNVVVYCVSCVKALWVGGKIPRYLPDLLFGETTDPQIYKTAEWHTQLEDYIKLH